MKNISKSLKEKLKNIKLLAMDIDGVLTCGELIVLHSGEEVKIWNVKDRMGFHLIKTSNSGIKLAWITGRKSRQVLERSKEIMVDELYQNCSNKKAALQKILKKYSLKPEEAAFVGDDVIDIGALRLCGFAAVPKDAPADVKKEADYITQTAGGRGVLREVIDMILKARGIWDEGVKAYL